jgi:hypothetical protein
MRRTIFMVKVRALQRLRSSQYTFVNVNSAQLTGLIPTTDNILAQERDVKTSSNLHFFFWNSSKDFKTLQVN